MSQAERCFLVFKCERMYNKAMSERSLKKLGVEFSEPKQDRSKNAIQNLVEAAEKIVDSGNASNLNARELSKVSGYSLGALVQRLGKVENVFLHTIAYGRERHMHAICLQAEAFSGKITTTDFAEFLVDSALHAMKNIVGPSIMRYYESRALGRVNSIADIHAYTDEVIPTLMKMIADDTTDTFREMSPFEAKYFSRAVFHILERPFIESDPNAGTEAHRTMAIRHIAGLLSK